MFKLSMLRGQRFENERRHSTNDGRRRIYIVQPGEAKMPEPPVSPFPQMPLFDYDDDACGPAPGM